MQWGIFWNSIEETCVFSELIFEISKWVHGLNRSCAICRFVAISKWAREHSRLRVQT